MIRNFFTAKSLEGLVNKNQSSDTPQGLKAYIPIHVQDMEDKAGKAAKKMGEAKTFIMSKEITDRDGEVVVLKGGKVDEYNMNPVVLWMHEAFRGFWDTQSYDPDNVIGKGKAYFKDDLLLNDVLFEPREINEKAWKIESKIHFGSIRCGSIGFIPLKGHWGVEDDGEDTGTYYITKWILTEFSIVTIPANPAATLIDDVDTLKAMAELYNELKGIAPPKEDEGGKATTEQVTDEKGANRARAARAQLELLNH